MPVGHRDESWIDLVGELTGLSIEDEVIFVSNEAQIEKIKFEIQRHDLAFTSQFVVSQMGRARQMNNAVRAAQNEHLWFLHCDSRLTQDSIPILKKKLALNPRAIYFFDLKFFDDGPDLMWLSELGVLIRSKIFRLPFGDQGFLVSRKNFEFLGGYCEQTPYGEDHLFIWRAHQMGLKISSVGSPIYTSARRYKDFGWRQTTRRHLGLTIKQATPELLKFLRKRLFLWN